MTCKGRALCNIQRKYTKYERHCEAFTGFVLQGKSRGNLLLRRMISFVDDCLYKCSGDSHVVVPSPRYDVQRMDVEAIIIVAPSS